jgi:hypothetical protein
MSNDALAGKRVADAKKISPANCLPALRMQIYIEASIYLIIFMLFIHFFNFYIDIINILTYIIKEN